MKKPKIITSYELSYSNDDKNNNQNYRNNNHCELYLYCRNTMIVLLSNERFPFDMIRLVVRKTFRKTTP